jgi:hypothetical protein
MLAIAFAPLAYLAAFLTIENDKLESSSLNLHTN